MIAEALEQRLLDRLAVHLAILERMVSVNSFTRNAVGVREVARLTANPFAALGFTAEYHPSSRSDIGPHLMLSRPGRSKQTVAIVSHLDTVYTKEEEETNRFYFRPDGDRLYGPGTGDIKGGTVLALMMLDAIAHVAPNVFQAITWQVGLNAAEEILEPEFSTLFESRLGNNIVAVLVFEGGSLTPGQWPLVVARKGRSQFRVDVEGRGAHAGVAFWQGRNALFDAARLALDLEAISDRNANITVNVGKLEGGTVVNRVPHAAVIEGEMRAFHPNMLDAALSRVRCAVDAVSGRGGKAVLSVSEYVQPWPQNDQTNRLFALWQRAGTELGMEITSEARGGLSDGNFFSARYPTLDGLGPTGANFHCSEQSVDGSKEQEFVLKSSFVPKALLNCVAIHRLACTLVVP